MESMRACPLARVWAGVRPGARVWGRRKSPMKKTAEPLPVQPRECFGVQRFKIGTSDCGEIRTKPGLG
jgi:hypothetical protein